MRSSPADPGPSDDLLVERIRQGDTAAFAELYARHEPVLSRRLRRVLVRTADVEDAVQMTFLEAHRALSRFRPGSSMEAWLHGIAFNVAARQLRSGHKSARLQHEYEQSPTPPQPFSAEELTIRQDLLRRLHAAMDELPPKKRIAFALHKGEGLTLEQIAAMTGTSPQTIWARVESARKLMVEWFAKRAGGSP